MKKATYELVLTDNRGSGIRCLRCGRTSCNANDVSELYCGYCHRFHERVGQNKMARVGDVVQVCPHPGIKPCFHRCLAIVDEVRDWGVNLKIPTPLREKEHPGEVFTRVAHADYRRIGAAAFR